MIWRQNDFELELILVDTGTHSDLFKKKHRITFGNGGVFLKRESDAFWGLVRRNPRDFVVQTCNPSKTGRVKDILSTKTGVWVDTKSKMMPTSKKRGIFLDMKENLMTTSKKRGIFLDDRV